MNNYTKRQWLILTIFSFGQFCSSLSYSLQGPFFPVEAEKKGAKPSEYGFVFGVYQLAVFITSPIFGRFMTNLGVKLVNTAGMFMLSLTCISFSFLVKINEKSTFLFFAFAIRILEGVGYSSFQVSIFSIIAKEFPDCVGSKIATLETCFGLGLIIGPSIGGALYELGGFMLPFLVIGIILFITAVLIALILPNQDEINISFKSTENVFKLLTKPPIIISSITIMGCAFSLGFVQATLEPHIRVLNLTAIQVGLVFILEGITYLISAPLWGWLCDIYISPFSACSIGSLIVAIGFLLIGPAPYLPLNTTLYFVIIALTLMGIGKGSQMIGTFVALQKSALNLGLPDNLATNSLISGVWTSGFSFGLFLGNSVAGILYDHIGFPWASQTVVLLHLILFSINVGYFVVSLSKIRVDFTNTSITNGIEKVSN